MLREKRWPFLFVFFDAKTHWIHAKIFVVSSLDVAAVFLCCRCFFVSFSIVFEATLCCFSTVLLHLFCWYVYTCLLTICPHLSVDHISTPVCWQYVHTCLLTIFLHLSVSKISTPVYWQYVYTCLLAMCPHLSVDKMLTPVCWQYVHTSLLTICPHLSVDNMCTPVERHPLANKWTTHCSMSLVPRDWRSALSREEWIMPCVGRFPEQRQPNHSMFPLQDSSAFRFPFSLCPRPTVRRVVGTLKYLLSLSSEWIRVRCKLWRNHSVLHVYEWRGQKHGAWQTGWTRDNNYCKV